MDDVTIIGGGLAGLTASIVLAKAGFKTTVIEKKRYPLHRVCGEYVSNEVKPFLHTLGIDVDCLGPSTLTKLQVSTASGRILSTPLGLGGFGISRYRLDEHLYLQAQAAGVRFLLNTKVTAVTCRDERFQISTASTTDLESRIAVGAHGKRSNIDQKLNRRFFYRRSPYMGVKYHIRTNFPTDTIQLDNFEGGYCGICKIEGDLYNLCYLIKTSNLKPYSSIGEMEEHILYKNLQLKRHFTESDFVYEKPEVINQITFERKTLVEDRLLFCGDAAGMITPLCGNGMAMAIHSGKLLAEAIITHAKPGAAINRQGIEKQYVSNWQKQFGLRLRAGRIIQRAFGSNTVANMAVSALNASPALTKLMVANTHGQPF